MIQREDLARLAKKYQISEYVVAREYLQIVILKELYSANFSKEVYFKGGTAIRLIYGGQKILRRFRFYVRSSGGFSTRL